MKMASHSRMMSSRSLVTIAGAADREAGAGKRMALEDVMRECPRRVPECADLVLEEFGQRLEHFAFGLEFEDAVAPGCGGS